MSCKSLLREWGFEQYIELFESEEIDLEALLDLTEFSLCQLVPKAGPRTKLMKKIKEYKAANSTLKEAQKSTTDLESSVQDLPDFGIFGNNYERVYKISIPSDDEYQSPSAEVAKNSIFLDEIMSIVKKEPEDDDLAIVKEEPEDEEMPIVPEEPEDEPMPTFQELQAKENPSSIERALLTRPNDAKLILANYPKIKGTVKRCEKNYIGLKSVHRNLLCEVIIQEELKTVNHQISSERFKALAHEIIQLFPREKASMYYIPHISIKKNNKLIANKSAKGKLYHKYTNFRKKLRQGGLLNDGAYHLSEDNSRTLIAINVDSHNFALTQSVLEAILWLNGRAEICERVQKEWEVSRNARIQELRNEINADNKTYLYDYFHKKYPFLKQPLGYTLLLADFNNLYPASKNALTTEWNNFSTKVKMMEGIDKNIDISDAQVFLLLAKLFEDEGLTTVSVNKKFRARKDEMMQTFLFQAQTINDLQPGIEVLKTKAQIEPTRVQPFAAIVGYDLTNVEPYCVISGVQYKVPSVRDVIDITFKCFHALHASYPRASECYWFLLQKAIYKLSTPWDETIQISQVDILLDRLSN